MRNNLQSHTEYLEKELFFNNFFNAIISKFNLETYDNIGWEFLQRIELKVNPNFLYLNSQKTIPNKNRIVKYFEITNSNVNLTILFICIII